MYLLVYSLCFIMLLIPWFLSTNCHVNLYNGEAVEAALTVWLKAKSFILIVYLCIVCPIIYLLVHCFTVIFTLDLHPTRTHTFPKRHNTGTCSTLGLVAHLNVLEEV